MKNHLRATGLFLMMAIGSTVGVAQSSTMFTYQGKLVEGGQGVSRNVDMRVRMMDAAEGGAQQGPALQINAVAVSGGVFSVNLDFGAEAIATGAPRWLEISVKRPGDSTVYETMLPRTLLTSVPASMSTRGIVVDAAGRVGINSAVPAAMLDVRGVTDSGIYLQAGNGQSFVFSGGTVTPGSNVQIYGGTGGTGFFSGAGVGGTIEIQAGWGGNNSTGNGAVGGELYLIGGTGGTGAYGGHVIVEAGAGGTGQFFGSGGNGATLFLRGGKGGKFNTIGSNGATGNVVVDQGNLGIGTAGPLNALHVSTGVLGSGGWQVRLTNTTIPNYQAGMRISDGGFLEMTNQIGGPNFARLSTTGAWTAVSDLRLKTDVHEADGMLAKALALRPITYKMVGVAKTQLGFGAQQVEELLPALVERGEFLTMDYARLSVVAIGAIQEQERELVRAKGEMEAMRAKNAELEARLERMEKLLEAR